MVDNEFWIQFVFGKNDPQLFSELSLFWDRFRAAYKDEMKGHSLATATSETSLGSGGHVTSLDRQPAAIARGPEGSIVGIVFVALTKVEDSLDTGEYVYFQRMYTLGQKRSFRLSNQLYTSFLKGFKAAKGFRDPRARYLLAENANPGLRRPSMRRYFFRLGFRMLGINHLGYEVWRLPLQTR